MCKRAAAVAVERTAVQAATSVFLYKNSWTHSYSATLIVSPFNRTLSAETG